MKVLSNNSSDILFISDEEKTLLATEASDTSSGFIYKRNIIFIDTRVADYKSLLVNIQPDTEVVILDPTKDGITQITESLLGKQYDSLHIVSHGSAGSLQLGSNYLNSGNLSQYASQLQQWKTSLTEEADILLYGCDVAAGETGVGFVQQLSQMTGADVAASNDLTGNSALGGDWDLEVKTGKIEAGLAFSSSIQETFASVLNTPASFTAGAYSQNFNSLATTGTNISWTNGSTITGWYASSSVYNAGTGSSLTGSLYSFGSTSSTERALGSLASGGIGNIYYGLRLVNNTGSAINSLQVAYTGEQWRNNANVTPQKLNFSYQTGTTVTSLNSGIWTSFNSLNFNSPIASLSNSLLDGNLVANRTVIAPTRINLATPLKAGDEIMLRWEDIQDSGNNHALAIDDLSVQVITPTSIAPTISFSGVTLSYSENATPGFIGSGATVTDDFTDFDAGTLTVSIVGGSTAGDRISIKNQGNGAGQIGLDGRVINFEGKRIGTFKGGIDTENFVITFETVNATSTVVQAILNNIIYSNVAENLPNSGIRTLQIVLKDGDGLSSNSVTRNINVMGQNNVPNDPPLIGNIVNLYDSSVDTLPTNSIPDSKGWIYSATTTTGVVRTNTTGGTRIDTTGNNTVAQAGFANITQTLNNVSGYIVSFTAQVLAESHNTSTANKNNDGKDDRAGFSVLVVSSDNTKAIELGFWEDRIWAQEDGTTQINPSLEPDDPIASNFRTLFTQAEYTSFNTKNTSVKYDLAIKDDTYTLVANRPILKLTSQYLQGFETSPCRYFFNLIIRV
jgi:Domain of unknown function (DUF4347)